MQLKKRNGVYYVHLQVPVPGLPEGRRVRKSTGERDIEKARQAAKDIVARLLSGDVEGRDAKGNSVPTLSEVFAWLFLGDWSPQRSKSYNWNRSRVRCIEKDGLGSKLITELDWTELDTYQRELEARGLSAATINRRLSAISKALKLCAKRRNPATGVAYLTYVPETPYLQERNQKDRVVSREEEKLCYEFMQKQYKLQMNIKWWAFERYIRFLADTGARKEEARTIKWTDLCRSTDKETSLTGRAIFPRYNTKTDKPRSVPLTARVQKDLMELRSLFGAEAGPFVSLFRAPPTIYNYWNLVRSGVPQVADVTPHTWRHTCATRLVQGGMDLYRVSEWLGHTDMKMTKDRYAHLVPDNLNEGVAALEGAGTLRLVKVSD